MNDEQINIAIAESMGWHPHPQQKESQKLWTFGSDRYGGSGDTLATLPSYVGRDGEWTRLLPDYCNDLNAMCEVTQTISASQQARFAAELSRVVGGKDDYVDMRIYMIHATAAQRAEAYLKTIGKWES